MTAYVAQGTLTSQNTFFCVKPSATLSDKIIRVDFWSLNPATVTPSLFTGGGTISGGSTVTPTALRVGAPSATSTVKNGATAITGTRGDFTITNFGTGGGSGSFSAPLSLFLGAGANAVFALSFATGTAATVGVALYFDEVRLQPSY